MTSTTMSKLSLDALVSSLKGGRVATHIVPNEYQQCGDYEYWKLEDVVNKRFVEDMCNKAFRQRSLQGPPRPRDLAPAAEVAAKPAAASSPMATILETLQIDANELAEAVMASGRRAKASLANAIRRGVADGAHQSEMILKAIVGVTKRNVLHVESGTITHALVDKKACDTGTDVIRGDDSVCLERYDSLREALRALLTMPDLDCACAPKIKVLLSALPAKDLVAIAAEKHRVSGIGGAPPKRMRKSSAMDSIMSETGSTEKKDRSVRHSE